MDPGEGWYQVRIPSHECDEKKNFGARGELGVCVDHVSATPVAAAAVVVPVSENAAVSVVQKLQRLIKG